MNNLSEVIATLEKHSGIDEIAQLTVLKGNLDGVGEVEITIRDRGEGTEARWSVGARTLDEPTERRIDSNTEDDLETAIVTTRWQALRAG